MDENIISFNFTNWVTVVAMVAGAAIVMMVLTQLWHHYQSAKNANTGG